MGRKGRWIDDRKKVEPWVSNIFDWREGSDCDLAYTSRSVDITMGVVTIVPVVATRETLKVSGSEVALFYEKIRLA